MTNDFVLMLFTKKEQFKFQEGVEVDGI